MNELTLFNNPDFGEVRTLETNDGKVLFCGADVAKALGYAKPNNAIQAHCRYTLKQSVPHPQNPDKTIEMTFIPESDIYRLTFGSKLPNAEKFTDWITEEVIPSIMRTGSYSMNGKAKKASPNAEKRLDIQAKNAEARVKNVQTKQEQILFGYYKELNLSPESFQLLCASAYKRMTGEEFPLALPETEKTWSAGEVGEMLGVSANKIGRTANAHGLKTDEYGIMVLDTAQNGKQIPTFRYNQHGIDKLKELLKN